MIASCPARASLPAVFSQRSRALVSNTRMASRPAVEESRTRLAAKTRRSFIADCEGIAGGPLDPRLVRLRPIGRNDHAVKRDRGAINPGIAGNRSAAGTI